MPSASPGTTSRPSTRVSFKGSIGDPAEFSKAFADPSVATWKRALTPIGTTITAAAPLAIAGVGLTICYRAGAFNIGSHAQVIGGGLGASWVGFSFPGMPWFPHVLLAFVAAAIGGGICGLIPGLLKALTGASEVIVTIMGNYVMANVLTYLLSSSFFKVSGQGVDNPVGKSTLPSASLTPIFPVLGVNAGFVVAVLVVVFAAALLNRSRLGFEMQIAGAGSRAADVSGIRRNLVFVSAFVVSGAVVGLAGAVQVLGVSNQLQVGFGGDIGTLAILVAFVGNVKPLGAAAAALLYGGLQAGGLTAQFDSRDQLPADRRDAGADRHVRHCAGTDRLDLPTPPEEVSEVPRMSVTQDRMVPATGGIDTAARSLTARLAVQARRKAAIFCGLLGVAMLALAIGGGSLSTTLAVGNGSVSSLPVSGPVWVFTVVAALICFRIRGSHPMATGRRHPQSAPGGVAGGLRAGGRRRAGGLGRPR